MIHKHPHHQPPKAGTGDMSATRPPPLRRGRRRRPEKIHGHDHVCATTTHTRHAGAHYFQWHPLMEQVPPGTHPPTRTSYARGWPAHTTNRPQTKVHWHTIEFSHNTCTPRHTPGRISLAPVLATSYELTEVIRPKSNPCSVREFILLSGPVFLPPTHIQHSLVGVLSAGRCRSR